MANAGLTYEGIKLGEQYGPYKYPMKDRIGPLLEAISNAHPWQHGRSPWGPSVAPPSILGTICLAFIDSIAAIPAGTAHVAQTVLTQAALRLDRQPIAYGAFTEKFERDGQNLAIFEARVRDETGLLVGHARSTLAFSVAASKHDAPTERKGHLESITRTVSAGQMSAFSQDVPNAGGAMLAADYISEMMTGVLGKDWFENAEMSLQFPGSIQAGDTLTANGKLHSETLEGAVLHRVFEVWAENQNGEAVAVGTAGSLVIPPIATLGA
ncbi:MAG: hypothetical protein ABI559_11400 [Chloroflexota bacterium]